MRFDPSLLVLIALAVLAAIFGFTPAAAQMAPAQATVAPRAEPLEATPGLDGPVVVEAAPLPFVYDSRRTGLRVVFPAGWDGPVEIDETRLPGYASYRFTHAAGSALDGVTVIVERIVGLNPIERERWRRGQTAYGYHGLRPTAAVDAERLPFGPATAFEATEGPTHALMVFTQRGEVFWTVHAAAPARTFTAHRGAITDALRGIGLSADLVEGPTASR